MTTPGQYLACAATFRRRAKALAVLQGVIVAAMILIIWASAVYPAGIQNVAAALGMAGCYLITAKTRAAAIRRANMYRAAAETGVQT